MTYPRRIRLSKHADTYLTQLVDDLIVGDVELHQLPQPLADLYLYGHLDGIKSVQPALDRANADADRLYVVAYNPAPPIKPAPSYAELEQRRGNPEHADRVEADLVRRFEATS